MVLYLHTGSMNGKVRSYTQNFPHGRFPLVMRGKARKIKPINQRRKPYEGNPRHPIEGAVCPVKHQPSNGTV
jgi:hypothetical protein